VYNAFLYQRSFIGVIKLFMISAERVVLYYQNTKQICSSKTLFNENAGKKNNNLQYIYFFQITIIPAYYTRDVFKMANEFLKYKRHDARRDYFEKL